jgi:arylsulfatase A-like enzyme
MYEHTVGTPLVIAGPGLPRDRRVRAPIYLRDLYPTICALTGVPVPAGIDGKNRAAVLQGGEDRGDRLVFGYYMDTQRMVRGDRWKLIEYPKARREQLFDLETDPLEEHDLGDNPRHEAVREQLRAELLAWQVANHDPLFRPGPEP